MKWLYYAIFTIDLAIVLVLIGLLVPVMAVIRETSIGNLLLLARSGDHHEHDSQEAEQDKDGSEQEGSPLADSPVR